MTATRYCTLEVGELLVGIEVDRVREILVDPEITPMPLAPPGVLGLLNRRGEIVTVFDARVRLGTGLGSECGSDVVPHTHAIVSIDGETVSLAADGEGEVIEVDAAAVQAVPETVAGSLRRMLSGIAPLGDGRLMLTLRSDRAPGEGLP